jgi:ABC-type bacteriocin/lantibiotic exporter with double-glycine peptidase domain
VRYPTVLQQNESDCGPANLRALARHHGVELRNETVRRICRNVRSGSSVAGLRQAFERLGFRAAARTIDLDELRRHRRELLPAIAVLENPGTGLLHYVTIVDVRRDRVRVMDPASGLSDWTATELLERWYRLEHDVQPAAFERGNRDPENLAAVRRDLVALGVEERTAERLLERMPAVDVDDRIRWVRSLAGDRLLRGLGSPAALLERAIEHPDRFPIPDAFVTVARRRDDDGRERLRGRGHLILTVAPGPEVGTFSEKTISPVRRLLGLVAGERRIFLEATLAAGAVAILALALPLLLQLLVDHLLAYRDARVLVWFFAGFLLLQLARQAFGLYRRYLLVRLSQKIDLFLMAGPVVRRRRP